MDYDPSKYDHGAADSVGPAAKLIAQLVKALDDVGKKKDDPLTILDIGCGPGNTVRLLRQTFPRATLIGVDIDQAMVDFANEQSRAAGTADSIRYHTQDVCTPWAEWNEHLRALEGKVDGVFSNYALHWILEGTDTVASNVWRLLRPGTGVLACDRLYLGDLREVCPTAEAKAQLMAQCSFPSENEFFDAWLFSLRAAGFRRFEVCYHEPMSWFVEEFYRNDFSTIPLRWYHHYLKPEVANDESVKATIKELFLQHRYHQVIVDDQGVKQAQIKQRLWTFVTAREA